MTDIGDIMESGFGIFIAIIVIVFVVGLIFVIINGSVGENNNSDLVLEGDSNIKAFKAAVKDCVDRENAKTIEKNIKSDKDIKEINDLREIAKSRSDCADIFKSEGAFISFYDIGIEAPIHHIQDISISKFGSDPFMSDPYENISRHISGMNYITQTPPYIIDYSGIGDIPGIYSVCSEFAIDKFSKQAASVFMDVYMETPLINFKGYACPVKAWISVELASGSKHNIKCWDTEVLFIRDQLHTAWKDAVNNYTFKVETT